MRIQLGDKVKDMSTGLIGVAVARTQWLNGCFRITIQPPIDKDGKVPDCSTFDEPQVEVVEARYVKPNSPEKVEGIAKSGGPIPTPKNYQSLPR